MSQLFFLNPNKLIFPGLLFAVLLLSSCKKQPEEIKLTNYWQLTKIEKKDVQPPTFIEPPDTLFIRVLFGPLGFISIESYCNTGTANYIERGASLEINSLSMTEIACPNNEPIDWESVFVYNFGLAEYYLIEGETLIILTDGDYHLHFKKL